MKHETYNNNANDVFIAQNDFLKNRENESIDFRKQQLLALERSIMNHLPAIYNALKLDLGKSEKEAYGTEVKPILREIKNAKKNLHRWMRPIKPDLPFYHFGTKSRQYKVPWGKVLIISAWNYPFFLTLIPLISAIAGGNTSFIIPSEESPESSDVLQKLINDAFPEKYIYIYQGKTEESVQILLNDFKFDYIFFSGNSYIGKIIAKLASEKLIPVRLETGGKSPCIVDESADIENTAKRIVWSKLMNAGQTCVAPDYILVHDSKKELLINNLKNELVKQLGENPISSDQYGRMISNSKYKRLVDFLQNTRVIHGGRFDAEQLYIEPTLIEDVHIDSPVMDGAIFGPIMPIITFSDHDEVLKWIERNSFPVSIYIYSENKKIIAFYKSRLRFGGCSINFGLLQYGNPYYSFGGVSSSGLSPFYGKSGFDLFTRTSSFLYSHKWRNSKIVTWLFGK